MNYRTAFIPTCLLAAACRAAAQQPPLPPAADVVQIDPEEIKERIRETVRQSVSINVNAGIRDMILAQIPRPAPNPRPSWDWGARDSEERLYRQGTSSLDRGDWEKALASFEAAAAKGGSRADAAYYWKAYALAKLGRRDAALSAIADLQKAHPASRWLNDAKALELEVKQAGGQPVSPEKQTDEDLKLMAINGLLASDPDRAIPLLEKVLSSSTSPRLRERALFVLAQSRTPQARDIVLQFAKGKGNPDLQLRAIEYLSAHGGKENAQTLNEIYNTSSDPAIKRRILRGYMTSGDRDRIVQIAKSEPNLDLRREAVRQLGALGANDQLSQLYAGESSVDLREEFLHAFVAAGDTNKLLELAKSEKEPRLRKQAIRSLASITKRSGAGDTLTSLYANESDPSIKKEIQRGLFIQGNAKGLIDIARRESDPNLKREAVQQLSTMKSKEATDYLVELLNK